MSKMRCPKCGKDGAFLFSKDGIKDFGDKIVQIMHDCQSDGIKSVPKIVGAVKITVQQLGGIYITPDKVKD